jgi:hypothetical protein
MIEKIQKFKLIEKDNNGKFKDYKNRIVETHNTKITEEYAVI